MILHVPTAAPRRANVIASYRSAHSAFLSAEEPVNILRVSRGTWSQIEVIKFRMKLTRGRGIPAGYITTLEARLAETEAALFTILNARQSPTATLSVEEDFVFQRTWTCFVKNAKGLSKEAKAREWARLPLSTEMSRSEWFKHTRPIVQSPNQQPMAVNELTSGFVGPSEAHRLSQFFSQYPSLDSAVHAVDWAQQSPVPNNNGEVGRETYLDMQGGSSGVVPRSPTSAASPSATSVGQQQPRVTPSPGLDSPAHPEAVNPPNGSAQSYDSRIYF